MVLETELDISLKKMKMKLYRSRSHGNCFFQSISKFFKLLGDDKGTTSDIRKNCINYILQNQSIREYISMHLGMTNEEIDNDLYELRVEGVYELDIFDILPVVIATQYNIKVSIYTYMDLSNTEIHKDEKDTYLPIEYGSYKKRHLSEINLLYRNLEHYDLLYPI